MDRNGVNPTQASSDEVSLLKKQVQDTLQKLEKRRSGTPNELCCYNGTWIHTRFLPSVVLSRNYFKTDTTRLILATVPKSGTTWLKALTFSIVNRHSAGVNLGQSPLLTANPHALVPFLDIDLFRNVESVEDLENVSSPEVLATHLPYHLLPKTVTESGCRMIYICRNPLDHFVSTWQFVVSNEAKPPSLEEAFDLYCQGIHAFGPVWDHVEGYWNAHLENPEKLLFLRYEDLKMDTHFHIKKIAEFVGCPFSPEEEDEGLVERISDLCSFKSLKNMEVNKSGSIAAGFQNSSLFRKGEVGDYANHLTSAMVERLEKMLESKLNGFKFKHSTANN